MEFELHGAPACNDEEDTGPANAPAMAEHAVRHAPILVVDIFDRSMPAYPLIANTGITLTMARHGVIAVAPLHPESGITCKSLKLFQTLSSRCPSLSIQAYVQTLCNMQAIAYKSSYRRSFSVAFDIYLEIKHRIDKQLDSLVYNNPLTALRMACPACSYKTKCEPTLKYSTLTCIDGNNSAKRVQRTSTNDNAMPYSIELQDERTRESELFIERAEVDDLQDEVQSKSARTRQDKEGNANATTEPAGKRRRKGKDTSEEGTPVDGVAEETPCTTRWVNLASDSQKRMWGIFEETGIFIAACRHGVVFAICDMIRSGEL